MQLETPQFKGFLYIQLTSSHFKGFFIFPKS